MVPGPGSLSPLMPRFLLLVAALACACSRPEPSGSQPSGSQAPPRAEVRRAQGAEVKTLVDKGSVLLDVREADEVDDGMISAARWVPFSKIQANDPSWQAEVSKLPRDQPVIVYCAAGGRAQKVAEKLAAMGVQAVNGGGYDGLKSAGLATRKP